MKVSDYRLWVCPDCLFGIENGYQDCLSDDENARIDAAIAECQRREGGHLAADWDANADEDTGIHEFSWHHCDCCHSPLGGSRHRYAILS